MNTFLTVVLKMQFLLSYYIWSATVTEHGVSATINLVVTLIATCMALTFYITFISVNQYIDDYGPSDGRQKMTFAPK